jgi:hypothetical protein
VDFYRRMQTRLLKDNKSVQTILNMVLGLPKWRREKLEWVCEVGIDFIAYTTPWSEEREKEG